MPGKSRSRIITSRRREALTTRRLPSRRAPTHPGEMLRAEFLEPLGISQSAFAARLNISWPRLNEIVREKRGVTIDTALRLARVTGTSAEFWLNLQVQWDLWHALRDRRAAAIDALEPLPRSAQTARLRLGRETRATMRR